MTATLRPGTTGDPEELTSASDQLTLAPMRAEQEQRARLVVAEQLGESDPGAAYRILQALGLVPDVSLTGTRKHDRVGLGRHYAECGTVPGAQAHHRAGEPLCQTCQAWSDERHRRTRVAPGSRCGSAAGAQMHRQLGEIICDRCRQAESAKSSARHAATYVPSPRPPKRPRKPPLPVERPAQPHDRHLLLLAAYGAITCRAGHYLTAAGDDVTRQVLELSRAGWLNVAGVVQRPVVTDAGRAVLEQGAARISQAEATS